MTNDAPEAQATPAVGTAEETRRTKRYVAIEGVLLTATLVVAIATAIYISGA